MRPSEAAQHRRDSTQESHSGRHIHASGQTLLLAKVKIGRALDCRCGRHVKESTMVQLRIAAIGFCNLQLEARGGFVELPIGPITQFFGAEQGPKPSHELQTDSINIQRLITFQGLSVNLEFVMSEHSVQGISNFRHRLHFDEVSDKVSDKERKINPTSNSKMSPNSKPRFT